MILLQITLTIAMQALSALGFLMNVVIFIVMYRKYIKSTVNQEDLKDLKEATQKELEALKEHVDKQDRALHHRVTEGKEDWEKAVDRIEESTGRIYDHLLKTKKK